MVQEISPVQASTPQMSNRKRSLISAGIVGTGAAAAGYCAHRIAKDDIANAAQKLKDAENIIVDESAIRKELAEFWYKGKSVPEDSKDFFERSVKRNVEFAEKGKKSSIEFAKSNLEETKKFYKGSVVGTVIGAAALMTILVAVGNNSINYFSKSHKKEG
jgi:hypothetical protein